jgi:ribonuclease III
MREQREILLSELEKKMEYIFREKVHLDRALTHKSHINEIPDQGIESNERHEFLGDAVLDLVISHLLIDRFADRDEGELSKLRASIVNEKALANLAKSFDIGKYLLLGKGEERSDGRQKNSILANTYEAILAAVYLDGGFDAAFDMIRRHFSPVLENAKTMIPFQDFKTLLQEYTQIHFREKPRYELSNAMGPDHNKTFEIRLKVGRNQTQGMGKTKKEAQQMAARRMLELLNSPQENTRCQDP